MLAGFRNAYDHAFNADGELFTFDSELREVVGFTKDTNRIHKVSLKGKPWGQTSLYDAVGQAAKAVAERTNKHRALLVISDGVDTASKMTPAEVSGIASSIDVPVYLLRVVNPLDHPGGELEVIETELKRLAEEGPSAEELAGAKSYLTGAYALRFESSSSIANQLLWIQIEDLGIDYVNRRNDLIEQVSLDDIKRVANRLIEADRLITTIVGKPVGARPRKAPG